MSLNHPFEEPTAIRTNLGAIFVSLELSRSTWLITSLSPGGGEKMSKHGLSAGNIAALLARLSELKQKAFARTGKSFHVIAIQEAGLDGFWIHRVLQSEGVESHVVDPASISTSRRRRRAKTDRIDGEALVRALLAYKRGEPRVCAMVRTPTPEEEDRRRLCRERKTLTNERVQHVNRIKGLLFCQGISDYEPLRRNRRQRLDELKTGGGRPLPPHLKAQITRELDRLELLLGQIEAVEIERDALLSAMKPDGMNADAVRSPPAMLINLNGIGPEIAAVLWSEGLYRSFANRIGPRSATASSSLPLTWRYASSDRQIAPGLATLCNRAAMLTPSPIRSPSLSSTTSPRWMPIRNSMRLSGATLALRSTIPLWTSMAQLTASTTLRNSMMLPPPVRLTMRP
jgi:transposase